MTPAEPSPLARAAELVGDRWTLQIAQALLDGPRRFNELQESVPGIAPNILSRRLKHLEAEGLVLSRTYSERPRRFAYELTGTGRDLAGALLLLAQWGSHGEGTAALRHDACGTVVEPRWYCPTCSRLVEDPETTDLHHL